MDLGNFALGITKDDDVSVANLTTKLAALTATSIQIGSSSSSDLNILGDIVVGGLVDGVDIAALNTTVAGLGAPAWSSITGTPTTLSGYGITDATESANITNKHGNSAGVFTTFANNSNIKYVTATGALGTTITGSGTTADPYVITMTSPDTVYTLPPATSSALGGVSIIGTAANAAMQVATTTANRNYSIQHMTGAQAMVNVPWTDTTYNLATSSTKGLCLVTSTAGVAGSLGCEEMEEELETSRRYLIQHDVNSLLSVCVPWTDTVYTHPTTAGNKHIPSGGSAGNYLRHTGTSGEAGWSAFPTTITPTQITQIATNTTKVTFPGFGTTSGTALEGDTALLALGTSSTTALAGDTTTITTAQANAITANTAKVTFPGIGTSSTTCMAGNTSIPVDLTVSGAGTVHADNYTNTEPNSTNVAAAGALMDSELTDLAGVKGMTVANKADLASPTFTGTPAAPTAADGTNTTQIATTAFVKQELDARYSYQYINFSFKVSGISNENWYFPGQDGVNYYLWGNNSAGSADPVDVAIGTTITVDRYDYQSGIIIPKACELVSFHGQIRHHGYLPNTIHPVFALFKAAMPSDGTTSDLTPSCIAFNDDSLIGSGNRLNRINKIESTHTASLSAYDIIYPAAGANASPTSNGTIRGMITIVLKTLIP